MMEQIANDSTIQHPTFTIMPLWVIRSLDIFNGILAFYMATFGVVWNILALAFFLQSKKDVIKIIYISITIIDLVTCLMMAPIGVSDLDFRKGHFFSYRILCNAHGFLWNIAARLSVFLVMVLSVTRMVYLLLPFRSISKKTVVVIIALYTIMQIIQACVPFAVSRHFIVVNVMSRYTNFRLTRPQVGKK